MKEKTQELTLDAKISRAAEVMNALSAAGRALNLSRKSKRGKQPVMRTCPVCGLEMNTRTMVRHMSVCK